MAIAGGAQYTTGLRMPWGAGRRRPAGAFARGAAACIMALMIPLHDDNPISIRPVVTVFLIAACAAAFLWQLSLGGDGFERAVYGLGLIPAVLFGSAGLSAELAMAPASFTVFSSMFLHGGWMHLIGNMLYLWIFGNNIEDSMGHFRFIVFYLLCGVAAALAQALSAPASQIPMIGASGAVSGVLGAYLLLFPHARVQMVVPMGLVLHTFRLPAMVVLGLWIGFQLISSAITSSEGGGTAWFAHIGGFVAGMVLIPLFKYRHVRFFNPPRSRS
jgi:membrane associated rhomboid family serine protease